MGDCAPEWLPRNDALYPIDVLSEAVVHGVRTGDTALTLAAATQLICAKGYNPVRTTFNGVYRGSTELMYCMLAEGGLGVPWALGTMYEMYRRATALAVGSRIMAGAIIGRMANLLCALPCRSFAVANAALYATIAGGDGDDPVPLMEYLFPPQTDELGSQSVSSKELNPAENVPEHEEVLSRICHGSTQHMYKGLRMILYALCALPTTQQHVNTEDELLALRMCGLYYAIGVRTELWTLLEHAADWMPWVGVVAVGTILGENAAREMVCGGREMGLPEQNLAALLHRRRREYVATLRTLEQYLGSNTESILPLINGFLYLRRVAGWVEWSTGNTDSADALLRGVVREYVDNDTGRLFAIPQSAHTVATACGRVPGSTRADFERARALERTTGGPEHPCVTWTEEEIAWSEGYPNAAPATAAEWWKTSRRLVRFEGDIGEVDRAASNLTFEGRLFGMASQMVVHCDELGSDSFSEMVGERVQRTLRNTWGCDMPADILEAVCAPPRLALWARQFTKQLVSYMKTRMDIHAGMHQTVGLAYARYGGRGMGGQRLFANLRNVLAHVGDPFSMILPPPSARRYRLESPILTPQTPQTPGMRKRKERNPPPEIAGIDRWGRAPPVELFHPGPEIIIEEFVQEFGFLLPDAPRMLEILRKDGVSGDIDGSGDTTDLQGCRILGPFWADSKQNMRALQMRMCLGTTLRHCGDSLFSSVMHLQKHIYPAENVRRLAYFVSTEQMSTLRRGALSIKHLLDPTIGVPVLRHFLLRTLILGVSNGSMEQICSTPDYKTFRALGIHAMANWGSVDVGLVQHITQILFPGAQDQYPSNSMLGRAQVAKAVWKHRDALLSSLDELRDARAAIQVCTKRWNITWNAEAFAERFYLVERLLRSGSGAEGSPSAECKSFTHVPQLPTRELINWQWRKHDGSWRVTGDLRNTRKPYVSAAVCGIERNGAGEHVLVGSQKLVVLVERGEQ